MTPEQLESLIEALNASGALSFKGYGLELTFGPKGAPPKLKAQKVPHHHETLPRNVAEPEPTEEVLTPIPHKDDKVESIMKLSDVDLLNQLFPDSSPPEQE